LRAEAEPPRIRRRMTPSSLAAACSLRLSLWGRSERAPAVRATTETDGAADGAGARAAQTPERVAVRNVLPAVGPLPGAPAAQALADVARGGAEHVADVPEAAGPAHVLGADPRAVLAEEPPA